MAIIMEPRKDSNSKNVPWNSTTIPPSKPFVNICTTAYEPVASVDDLNFVKTRSSIYSSFHKNARTINFDIGYPKEAKWFETHSIADYLDEFKPVNARFVKNLSEGLHIRLDPDTLSILRQEASQKGIGPTTLVRMWIMEQLKQRSHI